MANSGSDALARPRREIRDPAPSKLGTPPRSPTSLRAQNRSATRHTSRAASAAPLRVALFAGENSGDVQAAHLARAMRARRPEMEAWGVGGPAMERAGVRLEYDSRGWGAMGVAEGIRVGLSLVGPLNWCQELLGQRLPDLVVLVDFGAFNKHIARRARQLGRKVFWYFPPGSWSRRARIGEELATCVDAVATPFPWSAELLRQAGVNAHFVGHPLLDVAKPAESREAFRRRHGIRQEAPLVAYFPGSRRAEIRHIWPAMAGAARVLREALPEVEHAVGVAASVASEFSSESRPEGVVFTGEIYDLLGACDCVVTKSGTITLEATIFERPMVIVYRGSWLARLEYSLWHKNRIRWIGMPNILAEETVCPELWQDDASAERIAAAALPWLRDPRSAEPVRKALRRVRKLLGDPGGVGRAADLALGLVASTKS